jgi:hypothetical protein
MARVKGAMMTRKKKKKNIRLRERLLGFQINTF